MRKHNIHLVKKAQKKETGFIRFNLTQQLATTLMVTRKVLTNTNGTEDYLKLRDDLINMIDMALDKVREEYVFENVADAINKVLDDTPTIH